MLTQKVQTTAHDKIPIIYDSNKFDTPNLAQLLNNPVIIPPPLLVHILFCQVIKGPPNVDCSREGGIMFPNQSATKYTTVFKCYEQRTTMNNIHLIWQILEVYGNFQLLINLPEVFPN